MTGDDLRPVRAVGSPRPAERAGEAEVVAVLALAEDEDLG